MLNELKKKLIDLEIYAENATTFELLKDSMNDYTIASEQVELNGQTADYLDSNKNKQRKVSADFLNKMECKKMIKVQQDTIIKNIKKAEEIKKIINPDENSDFLKMMKDVNKFY